MKIKVSLFIFFFVLLLADTNCKPAKGKSKDTFQDYFYVRQLPASNDFLQLLKFKSGEMKLTYVTVNKKLLFFTEAIKKKQILGIF